MYKMTLIGFIGVGTMGKGMVLNLAKNGYEVIAYNRTRSKFEEISNEKIKVAESVQEVAKANIILTCLPSDEMLFGISTEPLYPAL